MASRPLRLGQYCNPVVSVPGRVMYVNRASSCHCMVARVDPPNLRLTHSLLCNISATPSFIYRMHYYTYTASLAFVLSIYCLFILLPLSYNIFIMRITMM